MHSNLQCNDLDTVMAKILIENAQTPKTPKNIIGSKTAICLESCQQQSYEKVKNNIKNILDFLTLSEEDDIFICSNFQQKICPKKR